MAFKQRGFADMLKDGTRTLSGVEEATLKNIEACKKLAAIVRSSLGPNGKNKLVVNRLSKLFVTNDAATIIRELEVQHPAAKLLTMASQMQEHECGDGTNFVVVFGGELLAQAEPLIRLGLHPSEIIAGYNKAGKLALAKLEELACCQLTDLRDVDAVHGLMTPVIASKQYGQEELIAPLVARACVNVLPENTSHFNVDRVRVVKILGGGTSDSTVIRGAVVSRPAEGTIKRCDDAKIAVYVSGIDVGQPETKGVVLIKTSDHLENYSAGEEENLEAVVKEIADAGINVVVSGNKVSEMAMHFLEKYGIMVVKEMSKFQLRRLCNATGARPMVHLEPPSPDATGECSSVREQEIGSTKIVVFEQKESAAEDCLLSTIIIRGSTPNGMDDVERAIDDGVNAFKSLTRDPRAVPGAGAVEIELARQLHLEGEASPGLDQYAIKKFAEALEIVPRTLCENAGHDATGMIASLYAAHQEEGKQAIGVNVEDPELLDAQEKGILDLMRVKHWAIKLAVDAAVTVLRIDSLIMAREAGGPKMPKMGPMDAPGHGQAF